MVKAIRDSPKEFSQASDIANKLKSNRPNLSESSLKTYSSILFNLYNKLSTIDGASTLEWFNNNVKDILHHLEDKNISTKKSTLSALFVLTGNPKYQEEMMTQIKIMVAKFKTRVRNKRSPTTSETGSWYSKENPKSP